MCFGSCPVYDSMGEFGGCLRSLVGCEKWDRYDLKALPRASYYGVISICSFPLTGGLTSSACIWGGDHLAYYFGNEQM